MKGERNTVYLAGSVHALPKDHAEFPEQLERAYQAADVIVLEVDLDDMNPLDAVKFITTNGTLPAESSRSADVVGAEPYAARQPRSPRRSKCPRSSSRSSSPGRRRWILTQFALNKTGFDREARHRHADHRARAHRWQVRRRARNRHRPAERLRSIAASRNRPASCSTPPTTRRSSTTTCRSSSTPGARRPARASRRNSSKERAKSPELYDALLGARNRQWLPKIEALLDEDRDYLVVVGALHFVGRDGLLALLRSDGHKAVAVPAAKTSSADLTPVRSLRDLHRD